MAQAVDDGTTVSVSRVWRARLDQTGRINNQSSTGRTRRCNSERASGVTQVTWKGPACQISIRKDGELPRPGVVSRCPVCRLELVLDGPDRPAHRGTADAVRQERHPRRGVRK